MKKNAEIFLAKTLGDDFLESLGSSLSKSEVFKPGSKTITDTNDLFQGLQIVPRALLSLLCRELAPMQIGDTKEIRIPGKEDTVVSTTKHERDSYSGQVIQNNVKINDFLHRSLPGIGLVLMTVLELYNFEDLEKEPISTPDKHAEIQRIIDERLNLHSLVNKVVDGKMQQKDAINQLLMDKLSQLYKEQEQIKQDHKEIMAPKEEPKHTAVIVLKPNKVRPLVEFVEKRKKRLDKKEFSVDICKSETVECPDCGQTIFNNSGISACICYGNDMGRKVFLKKTEDGIKLSFPKSWGTDNIIMLLEALRNKK